VRVTYNNSRGISKVQIKFSGCRGSSVGQRGHGKRRNCIIFYFKGNENHQLDKIFVHHKIVSTVKWAEFVSDSMSYIFLRGR